MFLGQMRASAAHETSVAEKWGTLKLLKGLTNPTASGWGTRGKPDLVFVESAKGAAEDTPQAAAHI